MKNGKKIATSDLFLAAFIIMRTSERPLFTREESSKIMISFPDSEQVREAKEEFIDDVNGFRKFSQAYRTVRDEMFLYKEVNR